jgi:hypothetical protein
MGERSDPWILCKDKGCKRQLMGIENLSCFSGPSVRAARIGRLEDLVGGTLA